MGIKGKETVSTSLGNLGFLSLKSGLLHFLQFNASTLMIVE